MVLQGQSNAKGLRASNYLTTTITKYVSI